jgi:hypothetical protein
VPLRSHDGAVVAVELGGLRADKDERLMQLDLTQVVDSVGLRELLLLVDHGAARVTFTSSAALDRLRTFSH